MHPPNNARRDQFPIFDERPQPLRLEYEANSIVRRSRIAAGKQAKKALCASIHLQGVPVLIQDEYGIGLKLRHEKLHGTARCCQFWCIETSVTIERGIAGCEQQRIALTQWNLQRLGK